MTTDLKTQAQEEYNRRAEQMPTEHDALNAMAQAYHRLTELGWKNVAYCPKDGTHFLAIEAGSTGIFDCWYAGDWPDGRWWIQDGDTYPGRPILYKLYEEDKDAQ